MVPPAVLTQYIPADETSDAYILVTRQKSTTKIYSGTRAGHEPDDWDDHRYAVLTCYPLSYGSSIEGGRLPLAMGIGYAWLVVRKT